MVGRSNPIMEERTRGPLYPCVCGGLGVCLDVRVFVCVCVLIDGVEGGRKGVGTWL